MRAKQQNHQCVVLAACLPILFVVGCGSTNSRSATEQLLVSDAVDRVISQLNFAPLAGQTVYLDSKYILTVKTTGFVNAPYVTSCLRQQLTAAGCLLQDTATTADIIVEPRVGTLGSDGHEITFGVPQSSALSSAASIVSSAPAIPLLPEISLAKSDSQSGAAKIGVFAYYRGKQTTHLAVRHIGRTQYCQRHMVFGRRPASIWNHP